MLKVIRPGEQVKLRLTEINMETVDDLIFLKEVDTNELVNLCEILPCAQYSVLYALANLGVTKHEDIKDIDSEDVDLTNNTLTLKNGTVIDIPDKLAFTFRLALTTSLLIDISDEAIDDEEKFMKLGEKYLVKSAKNINEPISKDELEERFNTIIHHFNKHINS